MPKKKELVKKVIKQAEEIIGEGGKELAVPPAYALKEDTDAVLVALKELTKVITDLTGEWTKWRRAGKF